MDPEQLRLEAARRWEQLVASGVPKDQATAQSTAWLQARTRAAQFAGEADAIQAEADTPGVVGGTLRSAAQGGLLGFSDEVRGGVQALGAMLPGGRSPGEAYRAGADAERAALRGFREEHPVLATGGELAGAIGTGIATGGLGLVRGASGAAKVGLGRLAAVGAAEGAIAGAGTAEGGAGERVAGAAVGGLAGGVVGGGLPGLARGGGRFLDVANLRPGAKPGVVGQVANRLGVRSVAEQADQRLAEVLPDDVAPLVSRLKGSDRPLTPMDVSDNLAGRARAARAVGGPAKEQLPEYLGQRVAGQEQRIIDDALRLSGVGERASVSETMEQITARRAATARPLYDEAYAQGQVRLTPELQEILKKPSIRQAFDRARAIAGEEGVDLGEIGFAEGANSFTLPTVQALDYIKRGLDDVVYLGRQPGPGGLGPTQLRAVRDTRRAFMKEVDRATGGPDGAYARARAAYAGDTAMLEALEEGRNLWKMDPRDAQAMLKSMTPSEREMFVRGGLETMAGKIEEIAPGRDVTGTKPLAGSTRDTARLKVLFPDDDAFKQFQQAIADEATIAQTNRFVTGGSQTADKLMELASLAGIDPSMIMTGNVTGMVGRLAGTALASRARGYSTELAAEMVPRLTAEGPKGAAEIRRLAGLRAGVGQRLSRRGALSGAGALGAAAGLATSPED